MLRASHMRRSCANAPSDRDDGLSQTQPMLIASSAGRVAKRRPFKSSGAGTPDAVIWMTVLAAAATGAQVFFITDNYNDFCDPGDEGRWHGDLVGDLEGMGIAPGRVKRYAKVLDFNQAHVLPQQRASQAAEAFLANSGKEAAVRNEIEDAVEWFPLEILYGEWPIEVPVEDAPSRQLQCVQGGACPCRSGR